MSADEPTPEPGGPPGDDPFRKLPPEGGASGGSPYDSAPPPPSEPSGGAPYTAGPLAGMPPLANRGKRLIARIIDGLLISIPVGLIMSLIVGGFDFTDTEDGGKSAIVQGTILLAYLVYEGLMLTHYGQTVGKKLMNIRVAMLETGAIPAGWPGWIRAGVYTLPEIVPCFGPIFWLVNVLWCTWDKPYRQCLHDKAAKTVVVEAR